MHVVRHRQRAAVSPVIKFIVTVMALAAVSFGIALVWQNAQDLLTSGKGRDAGSQESQLEEAASVSAEPEIVYDSEPEELSSSADEKSEDDQDASGSDDSEPEGEEPDGEESGDGDEDGAGILPKVDASYARGAVSGAVPAKSEPVEYDYFEDAIFFGDSISTGIPLYMKAMVPNAAVVATQGVNTMGVNTSQCIDVDGVKMTMIDAAKTKGDRKKVYIMLGSNGLDLDKTNFIDGYKQFVESVKLLYPDAVIYVQSMLPVTVNVNSVYPSANINNDRITEYNAAICEMALSLQVNYVDVAQCMTDATGALPTEASPFDGMHLTPEYYIKWFDYLRSHTVDAIK